MSDGDGSGDDRTRPTGAAAIDIGGTLAKVVYWRPLNPPAVLPPYIHAERSEAYRDPRFFASLSPSESIIVSSPPCGVLRFLKFPTSNALQFVDFLKATKVHERYGLGKVKHVNATGGGAYKYAELAQRELGVGLVQHDEMQCLVRGMNYVLQHSDRELFYVREDDPTTTAPAAATAACTPDSAAPGPSPKLSRVAGAAPAPAREIPAVPAEQVFVPTRERGSSLFPYLVVNVGSGVSVLKITGPASFERVSGSGIGGGTFWGLTRLLTGFTDFAQVIAQCQPGHADEGQVDFLVRDVYGTGNANPIGLDPTLTASYFGKIQRTGTGRAYRDADIAKSLLHMVSDNVAEIGWLVSQVHRTELVVFCGGFLLDNHCVWQLITKSIRYWSHGTRRALFLAHDGYLGALGALLTEKPPQ